MKKLSKTRSFFALFILFVTTLSIFVGFFGCSKQDSIEKISKNALFLDTLIDITIYGEKGDSIDASIIDNCFELCRYYESVFSRTDPDSELYKLNENDSAQISDDLLHVLNTGLYYSSLTDGKFDITLGKISDLYNFSSEKAAVPPKSAINSALDHVGYQKIQVDGNLVTINDSETVIDLGSIAKGYIADKLKEYLISQGVDSAIINLGGNILCVGRRPDGVDFSVGIQYPFEDISKTIATVHVKDMSVVTSGIYERSFTENGRLYHHILNPSTGYPYDNNLLAVSIIGSNSETCDALSTVSFTLGLDNGLDLINSIDDVYAVFVTDDYKLHYSDGFEEKFLN